ncbi:MAG: DinB family protein [Pseudomonadota bacterium]
MKSHFEMLARYNAWANERLYAAAALLPDSDYRSDEKAFFGSVHGTLNHILVADRIWMKRFTDEGDAPATLDAILCDTLSELRKARRAEDARISGFVDGLSEGQIAGNISYTPITTPAPVTSPLSPLLTHFFNHQTHHRGQVHALLTRLTGDAPSLDLVYYFYEVNKKAKS